MVRSSGSFPYGMGCSRGSEHDPCFLGQGDDPRGAAIWNLEADEVTALRPGPAHAGNIRQLLVEDLEHLLEFGRDQGFVLVHQLRNGRRVLEKANMTQLVDLVRTNGSRGKPCQQPLHVILRCGEEGQPGSGKRDLRGRSKDKGTVGIPMACTQVQNIGDFNGLVGQMMNSVGIVPIEAKIGRRGLHRRQSLHDRIGIDSSRRIAVLGNAPHALDGGVLATSRST